MTTKLEKANQALKAGWSKWGRDRMVLKIDKAAELTQDFIAYKEDLSSPICASSLALILNDITERLDQIDYTLTTLERRLDG